MKISNVKNKGIKVIITTVITMFIVSSAVYAISSNVTNSVSKDEEALKNSAVKALNEDDKQKIMAGSEVTYDEWKNAMEQSSKKLPRDQELALYNQGYDFYDIQVAEDLAGLCDKTPQDLLNLKGKTSYSSDGGSITDSSKPWNDIVSELKIKFEKPTQTLGITSAQINDMKQHGLSDADIEQVAILSFNYKKDYKEILSEKAQGTSTEDLKKQYWQTRQDDSKKQNVPKDKARANTEKLLKKQYNITDDEIKTCGEYGINDMVQMALAKDVAIKNNVKLTKVLEIKRNKNNWKDARDEAGGK